MELYSSFLDKTTRNERPHQQICNSKVLRTGVIIQVLTKLNPNKQGAHISENEYIKTTTENILTSHYLFMKGVVIFTH